VPGKHINTTRYREVFVKDALHPNGMVVTGETALIIQHETDHLEGILITDRGSKTKVGRNDPCPCGKTINGKPVKWKKCHGKG
jgi:peptide deformylase